MDQKELEELQKLPFEKASKLGHLDIINSEWIQDLLESFESIDADSQADSIEDWTDIDVKKEPFHTIWAVDGSYSKITSTNFPKKELAYIKTALMTISEKEINKIDKEHPHPLQMQDIMKDSALFHATVLPLKNIVTQKGSIYESVRNIIYDSTKNDSNGEYFKTLKWLAYKKWNSVKNNSPDFQCPLCGYKKAKLLYDNDTDNCSNCGGKVFLTDMIGFHLDMIEDSAPDAVASSYMLIMENLMLFTIIRILWNYTDESILTNTLFIKDGPLTLGSQYSKLVPSIREFLEFAKREKRYIHIIGQEKSGAFVEHLKIIHGINKVKRKEKNNQSIYKVLNHKYVREIVQRAPDRSNPYGSRTNWGEKVYAVLNGCNPIVISIPPGEYVDSAIFPEKKDLIGLERILYSLESLISFKHDGALYPIVLVNGIASLSNYPSAAILKKFTDEKIKD